MSCDALGKTGSRVVDMQTPWFACLGQADSRVRAAGRERERPSGQGKLQGKREGDHLAAALLVDHQLHSLQEYPSRLVREANDPVPLSPTCHSIHASICTHSLQHRLIELRKITLKSSDYVLVRTAGRVERLLEPRL